MPVAAAAGAVREQAVFRDDNAVGEALPFSGGEEDVVENVADA